MISGTYTSGLFLSGSGIRSLEVASVLGQAHPVGALAPQPQVRDIFSNDGLQGL